MPSLYIASKAAKLGVDNKEAAALLIRLDEAQTALEVQEALDRFDASQG